MKSTPNDPRYPQDLAAYEGVPIRLVPDEGREGGYHFEATVQDEHLKTKTHDAIREAITKTLKVKAKATTAKLALSIMDEDGNTGNITGIHLGTGRVTGIDKISGGRTHGTRDLYPVNDYIRELLKRQRAHRDAAEDIYEMLGSVSIKGGRAYKVSAQEYDAQIKRLVDEHTKAQVEAERLAAGAGDVELMSLARKRGDEA